MIQPTFWPVLEQRPGWRLAKDKKLLRENRWSDEITRLRNQAEDQPNAIQDSKWTAVNRRR